MGKCETCGKEIKGRGRTQCKECWLKERKKYGFRNRWGYAR